MKQESPGSTSVYFQADGTAELYYCANLCGIRDVWGLTLPMEFERGEGWEWGIEDKQNLVLRRLMDATDARTKKRSMDLPGQV